MATSPQFVATPHNQFSTTLTTANSALDGTGTSALVFEAGVNGSEVQHIRTSSKGANAQTIARFWENNGSDPNTATNNVLIEERVLTATSVSTTTPMFQDRWPLNRTLKAGHRIYMTLSVAGTAGWQAEAVGGHF